MTSKSPNFPTTKESEEVIEACNFYLSLPGTHTSSTQTELQASLFYSSEQIDGLENPSKGSTSQVSIDMPVLSERLIRARDSMPDLVDKNSSLVLHMYSSESDDLVQQIHARTVNDIAEERPQLLPIRQLVAAPTNPLRVLLANIANVLRPCLQANRDCCFCFGFFVAFIISTSFLTAFFYRILTLNPQNFSFPSWGDKIYVPKGLTDLQKIM